MVNVGWKSYSRKGEDCVVPWRIIQFRLLICFAAAARPSLSIPTRSLPPKHESVISFKTPLKQP